MTKNILRRSLGIFLILAFILMNWAIYENTALIHSAFSPEIALIIAFILPIPLLILNFIFLMPLFHFIVRFFDPNLSKQERSVTEFTVVLTWGMAFCAALALMVNLFLSLPESVFANITEQGLIFVILLVYLLNIVGLMKMSSFGDALINKIAVAFFIFSFFILSFIIGINSPDIMASIKGTVFLFLVFPQLILLFFFLLLTFSYLIGGEPGMAMGGPEMLLCLIYSIFTIAGILFGALAFLMVSLF
jgi:hypothetical protein